MDETKLKIAFGKIKNEMWLIQKELITLKKTNILSDEIKSEIEELKSYNLEKFIVNLENEFKSLNIVIKEFNQRTKENGLEMRKLAENLEKYHFEISHIKKKLSKESNTTANAQLDIKILDDKLNELHEILNEKVSIENASTKLELESELARMAGEIAVMRKASKKQIDSDTISKDINEIAEMLNEKINLELSALRLEFTEEIAKVYDRCYNEVNKTKKEVKTTQTKTSKKSKSESLY